MASLAEGLRRITAVKAVLDSVRNSVCFETHAQNQAGALKSYFKKCHFNAEEASTLVFQLPSLNLSADITVSLISCLSGNQSHGSNVKLQDYTAFPKYLVEQDWNEIDQDSQSSAAILSKFVQILLDLGLRHPSCPTFRVLTAVYCSLTRGEDGIRAMTKLEKYREVLFVKSYFNRQSPDSPPPVDVHTLPPDPHTFRELYPSLAVIYRTAVPCPPPFDLDFLLTLADTFPLRKPRHSDFDGHGSLSSNGSNGSQAQNSQLQSMLNSFISSQQTMMKMLTGGPEEKHCDIKFYPPQLGTRFRNRPAIGDTRVDSPDSSKSGIGALEDGRSPGEAAASVDVGERANAKKTKKNKKKKKKKKTAFMPVKATDFVDGIDEHPAADDDKAKATADAIATKMAVFQALLDRDKAKATAAALIGTLRVHAVLKAKSFLKLMVFKKVMKND